MSWLVEEQTPIILLGALATAVMVVAFYQTRRLPALLGLGGVVLLTFVLLMVEKVVVTDVERVENRIYAAAHVIETNQVDKVVEMIAPDAIVTRKVAQTLLPKANFSRVSVSNLKVTIDELTQPPTATVTFLCRFDVKARQGMIPYEHGVRRFELTLVQIDDQWYFLSHTVTDPTGQGG